MIRLPYTGTYSLELITAQNGANVVVCYSDATGTAYDGGTQATTIVSATTTTICNTPAASTVRDIDEINIKNTYAGSHTITVQIDANGTNYPIIITALQADESLNYTHGSGWQCKDANGNTKASALTSMTSAQLAGIITDETGTGLVVFNNSPTLVTPALGTPASGVSDNLTTTTTTTAIVDTDFVDTNLAAGGKRKILWTAVKTYLNEVFGQLTGNLSQFASGGAIAPASINGVTVDSTTNKPVTAASLNGGTLPASVTTLAISTALADNDSDTSGATTAFVQSQTANNNNPTAIAQSINMTAAASGSNGIQVADNTNIDFGTGNFTLHWEGSLPAWTPSAVQILRQKHDGTNGWKLQLETTGAISIIINATTYTSTVVNSFTDGTFHKISVSVTRESASVAGSVVPYADGIQFGASVAITAGAPTTVDNAVPLYILGTSTARSAGRAKSAVLFNRALSASEVLDLCRNGVSYADKGASQTTQLIIGDNSTFASDTGWWTKTDASITINSAVPGKCNFNASPATNGIYRATLLDIGKRYRLTLTISGYSSGGIYGRFGNYSSSTITPIMSADGTYVFEVVAGLTSAFYIYTSGASTSLSIDDITLQPVGATLELTPEGIQPEPGQWLDVSGNGNHGLQPATGSSLMRPQRTGEVRWTNTWAGTHEAQFICGVNQAVLPSENIRIESITMRCSATGVNVILGDGSNTSRWVASVALAAYLDATVANRNHDGTNRKIVIDPDAIFTGSIITTIKYIILD